MDLGPLRFLSNTFCRLVNKAPQSSLLLLMFQHYMKLPYIHSYTIFDCAHSGTGSVDGLSTNARYEKSFHQTTYLRQPNSTLVDNIASDLKKVPWLCNPITTPYTTHNYTVHNARWTKRKGRFISDDAQPVCNDVTACWLNKGSLNIHFQ